VNPAPPTPPLQAIVLCGGRGTRLSTLYADRPKALVPIRGRPFIAWQIDWLTRNGVTDIHLAAGYKAEMLAEFVEEVQGSACAKATADKSGFRVQGSGLKTADESNRLRRPATGNGEPGTGQPVCQVSGGRRQAAETAEAANRHQEPRTGNGEPGTRQSACQASGVRCQVSALTVSAEPVALGTGGGLKFAAPFIRSDPFLVLNGDSLMPNLEFAGLERMRLQTGAAITLAATRIRDAGRYGTVEFGPDSRITAFREKAARTEGWINGGVYLVERRVLADIPEGEAFSLETQLFPALAAKGLIAACPSAPPLLDMGTPEGIAAMEEYLTSGVPGSAFPVPG
jgi:NDP-sugar pyrophosphorylase family protein